MNRKEFCVLIAMVAVGLVVAVMFYNSNIRKAAIFDAAGNGDLENVKLLIQQGAPINQQVSAPPGWTPLISAIFHNQTNIAYYLIEAGADVNLSGKDGQTPMMWATHFGDDCVPLVKELIAHGANLYATDARGSTIFDWAHSDPPKPKLLEALAAAKLDQEKKPHK